LALIVSGLALAFTVWFAWRFEHQEDVKPAFQRQNKSDSRADLPAAAPNMAQAVAKRH